MVVYPYILWKLFLFVKTGDKHGGVPVHLLQKLFLFVKMGIYMVVYP